MSLETHSAKRDRVYQRAFDHEEAQRLRAEGWSYPQLANHFGVSDSAVIRVCNPKVRERMNHASVAWMRENFKRPCVRGCGNLAWFHQDRPGVCQDCTNKERGAADIRPDELRCTKCGTWKPDGEFMREKRSTRRGHRSWCRACETAARRALRHANPEHERAVTRNYKRQRSGKAMADFVVMQKDKDGRWVEHDRVPAASRLHAIEKVADSGGGWVAVSASQLVELQVQPVSKFKVVRNGSGPERD